MGLGTELFKLAMQGHVRLYRASGGRLGSMGDRLLLLTTTGARSGKARTVPLLGIAHADGWLVVASAGGDPRHPAWYHNLVANPAVTVERRGNRQAMRARVAAGEERRELWQKVVDFDGRFAGYESKVEREIPVVVLSPTQ